MIGTQAKEFNLCLIRPDKFGDHGLRVFWVSSGKLLAGCHVPLTEEELQSGYSTTQTWLVECCRTRCPSGRFSSFHRCWNNVKMTTGFLFTSLTKVLLPWSLRLAGQPSSRKSPSGSKLLPLRDNGGYCADWGLFCIIPQICALIHSDVCRQLLGLHGLVCPLTCAVNYGTIDRQVCAFPNYV